MGLLRSIAQHALNAALDRIFPIERVQPSQPRARASAFTQKEPERLMIAQALNSPEVSPSMTATLKPEPHSQQEQQPEQPTQAELPWTKYEHKTVPELSTEQLIRQDKVRQKRDAALAREARERELELDQREVGFSCRLLIQATLPHSDPNKGLTSDDPKWGSEFTRTNGNLTLTIQAREKYGFPYGTYPRLLTSWMATEAVRTKERQLSLGHTLGQFLERLDLHRTGGKRGTIPRLRDQMLRFFTASFSATEESEGHVRDVGFRPVTKTDLFWDSRSVEQSTLWQSTILLNEDFFNELVKRPVPLDMAALKALAKAKSPMALDIYAWLTYRYSYLHQATLIPWGLLKDQFGADYGRERAFREKFIVQITRVKELYPDAKFDVTPDGLRLFPSRPHVRLLRA